MNGHAVWVDMHEVQVEADVLPHVGFHGGASISGPPCSGHREEMHQLRREDGSSRVPHKINWVGGSRRINHEEVASDSVPEERHWGPTTTTEIVKNHGKGTTKGKIHPAPKKTPAKGASEGYPNMFKTEAPVPPEMIETHNEDWEKVNQ